MPAPRRRRPSAALVVALLALFVAVGGPAEAARLIGSNDVKDRSLKTRDLSKKAVKTLQATPRRSVGATGCPFVDLRDPASCRASPSPAPHPRCQEKKDRPRPAEGQVLS